MKFKLLNECGEKTFALIFEKGDQVIGTLRQFATEQRLLACHFTAIGALSDVVVGFLDPVKKDNKRIAIRVQTEVLSLVGDSTIEDDIPRIHAHVVVHKSDGNCAWRTPHGSPCFSDSRTDPRRITEVPEAEIRSGDRIGANRP
jgi:predicted DNA-binding protein with PD1-like motif